MRVPAEIDIQGTLIRRSDYNQAYRGKSASYCMCGCNGEYTKDIKSVDKAWSKLVKQFELFPAHEFHYESGNYAGFDYITPSGNERGLYLYKD